MGPIMKCGCVAQSVRGGTEIPVCVIHDCDEIMKITPDLSGRLARCSYSPKGHADVASSFDLPFFEYHGPGSPEATRKCKCGCLAMAHEPLWQAKIGVVRRWFKIECWDGVVVKEFHAS